MMVPLSIPQKQCSSKENCIHPEGSLLPNTAEYFSLEKKRGKYVLRAKCKVCRQAYSEEYRKRPAVIRYAQEFNARPEQVKKRKEYQDRLSKEQKNEYRRQYRKRPYVAKRAQEKRDTLEQKQYMAEYRSKPENIARKRLLRQTPEVKAYAKQYRQREGMDEYFAEKQMEYRQTDSYQKWYQSEKGIASRLRGNTKRRMAMEQATVGEVTGDQLRVLIELYEGQCFYCGDPYQAFDHVTPISRGGLHEIENLVPACKHCNSSKGFKLFEEEWLPKGWC